MTRKLSPTIGSRLTIIIGGIILFVWMAFAVSIVFFMEVKKEYTSLIEDNIPRVELSNLLAQNSAKLAEIAASILGSQNGMDALSETKIRELNDSILDAITHSAFQHFQLGDNEQQKQLASHLVQTAKQIDQRRILNEKILKSVDQLRWLNLDVQDEVVSIGVDYGYNIELATNKLIDASDLESRQILAQQIHSERKARDLILQIGNDAALAELFLLQSAFVSDENQFRQFQALISDAVSRSNETIQELPKSGAYSTIIQSMEALEQLAIGEGGILDMREQWIEIEKIFLGELVVLQNQFGQLQTQLQDIGKLQSIAINDATRKLTKISGLAIRSLVFLTIFTGIGAAIILYGYIYRKIVHPIDQLAAAMRAISKGEKIGVMPRTGDNEIGQMAQSVYAFQSSVDEREQAFDLLKQTQAELVQTGKMAALGNLSAGISHEINQPLAAIMQRLYLLEKAIAKDDDKGVTKQVGKIKSLVDRMKNTIVSLKRFARRSEHLRKDVDVWDMIKGSVSLLKNKLKSGNITLEIDEMSVKVSVSSDPILAEQILINIISNAADAIMETDGPGIIKIYGKIRDDTFVLYVEDNGIGFDQITVEEAFDPFVTTKGAGIGMGLGLSISYNIARDLGGDLKLQPNDGQGISAIFELPLEKKYDQ